MKREDLVTIYRRAEQYCIVIFQWKPDSVELTEDGLIAVRLSYPVEYGREDVKYEEFSVNELNADLDIGINKRLEKEKEEQKIKEIKEQE